MGMADVLRFEAAMAARSPRPPRRSLEDQIRPYAPAIASYRALGHSWSDIAAALAEHVPGISADLIGVAKLRSIWSRHFRDIDAQGAADLAMTQRDRHDVRKLGVALAEVIKAKNAERAAFEAERATWEAERSQIMAEADKAITTWKGKFSQLENRIDSTDDAWRRMRHELLEERKKVSSLEEQLNASRTSQSLGSGATPDSIEQVNARWRKWAHEILTTYQCLSAAQSKAEQAAEKGEFEDLARFRFGEIPQLHHRLMAALGNGENPSFAPSPMPDDT